MNEDTTTEVLKVKVETIEKRIEDKMDGISKKFDEHSETSKDHETRLRKVEKDCSENVIISKQIFDTLDEMKNNKKDNKSIWIPTIFCVLIGLLSVWATFRTNTPPTTPKIEITIDESFLDKLPK